MPYSTKQLEETLEIVIPVRRNIFGIIFSIALVLCILMVYGFYIDGFLNPASRGYLNILALLLVLLIFGSVILLLGVDILWLLIGKEIIRINEIKTHYKQDILGFGTEVEFTTHEIKEIKNVVNNMGSFIDVGVAWPHFVPAKFWHNKNLVHLLGGEQHINFMYDGSPRNMAYNLKEAEAKELIQKIKSFIR